MVSHDQSALLTAPISQGKMLQEYAEAKSARFLSFSPKTSAEHAN